MMDPTKKTKDNKPIAVLFGNNSRSAYWAKER